MLNKTNKSTVAAVLILGLCAASLAQSGRKIVRAEPVAAPAIENEEDSSYSDSIPVKSKQAKPPTLHDSTEGAVVQNKTATEPTGKAVSDDETEVLRVETSLVTIPVSVFDREGRYIAALKAEDFKIFENGKEQEVAYFGTFEQPFTVVLLLDTSPSTQYKIEEIQAAATAFVNELKPQDRVMVIEFDRHLRVLTEPTKDRQKIAKAIRKADFGEGTSLYDAVKNTIFKRLSRIEGRKAVVLFTDGVDTTSSKAGYDDTLRDAEEADAMIFPIYYDTFHDLDGDSGGAMSSPLPSIPNLPFPGSRGNAPRRPTRRDYERGREYLDELAAKTGGRLFDTKTQSGGLSGAFAGIAEELGRQYTVGFYPQETGRAGERKALKVRVTRPNLIVRARDSYVVGANNTAPPATADTPGKKFSL